MPLELEIEPERRPREAASPPGREDEAPSAPAAEPEATAPEWQRVLTLRRAAMLASLERVSEEQGRVLYGDRWVAPEEALREARRDRRRHWVALFEVSLLILMLTAVAGVLGLLLLGFIGYDPTP